MYETPRVVGAALARRLRCLMLEKAVSKSSIERAALRTETELRRLIAERGFIAERGDSQDQEGRGLRPPRATPPSNARYGFARTRRGRAGRDMQRGPARRRHLRVLRLARALHP